MVEKNYLLKTKEKTDHRLKLNRTFNYIYKKGKRSSSRNLTLFTVHSKFPTYRIGYSISKKQGKAHERNLIKRRLREIVRLSNLPKPYCNYVILTRDGVKDLSFKELKRQVYQLFR